MQAQLCGGQTEAGGEGAAALSEEQSGCPCNGGGCGPLGRGAEAAEGHRRRQHGCLAPGGGGQEGGTDPGGRTANHPYLSIIFKFFIFFGRCCSFCRTIDTEESIVLQRGIQLYKWPVE